jgi:hypothetical protein
MNDLDEGIAAPDAGGAEITHKLLTVAKCKFRICPCSIEIGTGAGLTILILLHNSVTHGGFSLVPSATSSTG